MKKLHIMPLLLCLCSAPVFAGNFYLGPTLDYETFYINDIRFQAFSPRLTGGYGAWQTQWVYLAAEAFGSPKDYKYKDNHSSNQLLKVRYSFGASIIPGVFLDNIVMAYARLGLTYAEFSYSNALLQGYQAGLGFDVTATPSWHVRGEYDYAKFRNLSDLGSPRSDEYSVSVIYHFNSCED